MTQDKVPRIRMNGSTASRLEDAYMTALWTRQRAQWNLYAGRAGTGNA